MTYSSLTQLKVDIEKKGDEEIIELNVLYFITQKDNKKYRYTLTDGKANRTLIIEE